MARFNSAYGLCHLIDQKSLLGVSRDEESGSVVVTLGRNIATRYKLSDQKQLTSWSSVNKFSTPVMYNKSENKYLSVFENNIIKYWSLEESSLEKIRKKKFKQDISKLVSIGDNTVIVFKNGSTQLWGSDVHRSAVTEDSYIGVDEVIQDAWICEVEEACYLLLVTKFQNKYFIFYSIELDPESFTIQTSTVKKLKLRRLSTGVLGYCLIKGNNTCSLLTSWSDGFLYTTSVPITLDQNKDGVGTFAGTLDIISRKSQVSMVSLSPDHVGIYAADATEEGAILIIYNIAYNIVQARTHFKMFNKPPRMWKVGNSVLIVMGQTLVCVPYELQTESLSALLGSHLPTYDANAQLDVITIMPTVEWDKEDKMEEDEFGSDCPDVIRQQLTLLSSEGWPESQISKEIFNTLIENKNISALRWCLEHFMDIPEDILVKLITLCLSQVEQPILQNGDQKPVLENGLDTLPCPISLEQTEFLKFILKIPFNSTNLLKHLRSNLKFEHGILVLKYLTMLLSTGEYKKIHIEWTSTLIDAYYQQFLLCRDSEVLERVVSLKDEVDTTVATLLDYQSLMPLLNCIKSGRSHKKSLKNEDYSVIKIKFY